MESFAATAAAATPLSLSNVACPLQQRASERKRVSAEKSCRKGPHKRKREKKRKATTTTNDVCLINERSISFN